MIFKKSGRFRFQSFRLSSKLIVTYILLTVIPLSLAGVISYYQYTKSIEQQFGEYMPRSLNLANLNLERNMNELTNLPDLIYSSNDIVTILREDSYEHQSALQQDQFVVNNFLSRTYINGKYPGIIAVFMSTENRLFYSTRMDFQGSDLNGQSIEYGHVLVQNGNTQIIMPNEIDLQFGEGIPYIMLVKKVTDFDNRINLGTMFIAVELSFIKDILGEFENQEGAELWIMNKEGQIIYHTDESKIGQHDSRINNYPIMNGSFKTIGAEDARVISINESKRYDWLLIHSIPSKYLTEQTDIMRNVTVLVFILFALVTSGLSIFLALNVSRPIKKLSSLMKHVEMGNFQVDLLVDRSDEIGLLARSFNSMITQIRELIQKNYYIEIRQKDAELYALQAQINPHFMYNTLETMGMAVEEGDDELVVEMLTLLGRMLRYSLSNESKLVEIDEEVRHIQDFLTIQKYRFEDRVDFLIDSKVSMSQFYTPKFILQPIVENAIKYGLELIKGVHISILISEEFGAKSGKQDIVFRIRDNGPGITFEKLNELTSLLNSDVNVKGNHGVGLKNVHARIVMLFGNDYGLQLDSVGGKGAEVIIRIPMISVIDASPIDQQRGRDKA